MLFLTSFEHRDFACQDSPDVRKHTSFVLFQKPARKLCRITVYQVNDSRQHKVATTKLIHKENYADLCPVRVNNTSSSATVHPAATLDAMTSTTAAYTSTGTLTLTSTSTAAMPSLYQALMTIVIGTSRKPYAIHRALLVQESETITDLFQDRAKECKARLKDIIMMLRALPMAVDCHDPKLLDAKSNHPNARVRSSSPRK
jgi:hypothetical protein